MNPSALPATLSPEDKARLIRKYFTALAPFFRDGHWFVPSQTERDGEHLQRAIRHSDGTFERRCNCPARIRCTHAIEMELIVGTEPTEGELVWNERAFEDRWAHLMKPERKAS